MRCCVGDPYRLVGGVDMFGGYTGYFWGRVRNLVGQIFTKMP